MVEGVLKELAVFTLAYNRDVRKVGYHFRQGSNIRNHVDTNTRAVGRAQEDAFSPPQ